jgi:hypothetical protein
MKIKTFFIAAFILCSFVCSSSIFGQTILLQENFDNTNFASRGWYDIQGSGGTLSSIEHISGSAASFECRFLQGGTVCSGGSPMRHALSATTQVYVSYWIKHSSNWVGSGTTYHPHLIYLLTNLNTAYTGLAYTYLTAYIEENQGYPVLALQDGQNIDETKIGVDLTTVTENRSVAGCNGTQPNIGQSESDCYLSGSVHWNGLVWKGPNAHFFDPNQKTNWHFIEAFFQLNTISNGIGQPNGIVRYLYDGNLVINHSNVIMRSGKNPTMQFNQIVLTPYIGPGSPADQTIWYDNLTVATSRPTTTTLIPSPPTNLQVL